MPVTSTHSSYDSHSSQWSRCRDCAEGSDAVKKRGIAYLPQLEAMDLASYDAYKQRALFFGATGRTIQGLAGAVFRKPFSFEYPQSFEDQLERITPDGLSVDEFSRRVVTEVLTTGRVGLLVDAPAKEDADSAYVATYTAESIRNWRVTDINGELVLTMIVLEEVYAKSDPSDEFDVENQPQYRVLRLVPGGGDSSYRYQTDVYRQTNKEVDSWAAVADLSVLPTRNGVPIDRIPFWFVNSSNMTPSPDKPPLLDMVDVNLSHYRTCADLEHGAHYTALPTAVLTGFPTDNSYAIGSGKAWVVDDVQAKATFLEYKGSGLTSLSDLKRDKEQALAVLGARMLESQKKGVEAEGTHKIRQSGEQGALATIVKTASQGIETALKYLLWWSGASDAQVNEVVFDLNTDFISARMEPQQLKALMEAHQASQISQDTFLHNLKEGEILPQDRTIEEEKALIDAEMDEDFEGTVTPIKREFSIVKDETGAATGLKEA